MRFDFLPALPVTGGTSRPDFDRIAELRQAVGCSRGVILPGRMPYAAPLDCINRNATRKESYWFRPERDGPRKLLEPGGVPYWRTLGSPHHEPINNRAQMRHVMGFWRQGAYILMQIAVDAMVGVSAILLSAGLLLSARPREARDVLMHHMMHVLAAVAVVAVVGEVIIGLYLAA